MRKSELRRMEAKLRALETELDNAQMDEITDRAHEEYLRRCVVRDTRRNSRWKRYCRRVMVVAAATIALMVCSFAYTVMTPVTVSTANNAVRRAAIWVNDALQLGVEFPMPVDDGSNVKLIFPQIYNTLEEAHEDLGIALVYIEGLEELKLEKIETTELTEKEYEIKLLYSNSLDSISISMVKMNDENTIGMLDDGNVNITTDVGDVLMWKYDEGFKGVTIVNDYIVQIQANSTEDEFILICKHLRVF